LIKVVEKDLDNVRRIELFREIKEVRKDYSLRINVSKV